MSLAPEGTEFWRAGHSPTALTPPLHPHLVSSGTVRYSWKEGEKTLWLERRARLGTKMRQGFPTGKGSFSSADPSSRCGEALSCVVGSLTHLLLPFITATPSSELDHSSSSVVLGPAPPLSLGALSAMQMLVTREIAWVAECPHSTKPWV